MAKSKKQTKTKEAAEPLDIMEADTSHVHDNSKTAFTETSKPASGKQKIVFEKTEATPEEKEFIEQYNSMAKTAPPPTPNGQTAQNNTAPRPPDIEYGQLAGLIADSFNEVGVDRGYDPVTDAQRAFLVKHTARAEEKYLKDIMLYPEIEAGLAHVVVYLPKLTKKMTADNKRQKKT
jgi:hypothetical protein